MRSIKKGATSQSVYVEVLDSTSTTGGRKTGLAYNTASLTAYYVRNQGSPTAITLATLAAANSAWSSGGFVEVDATNMPGLYRLDLPDAAFASGVDDVSITLRGATGMAQVSLAIQLVDNVALDIYSRLGAPAGASIAADVAQIYGVVDTEVAAIKAKTDNLPTDPADASDIAASLTAIAGYIDTEVAAIFNRIGAPVGASISADIAAVKTQTAAIETDTQDIQARIPAALVSGRIDASIGAAAANTLTASALATDAVAEIVDAVWDEAIAGHQTANTFGRSAALGGGVLEDTTITGTPSSTSIQLAAGSTVDNFYNDQTLHIVSGTGLGQARAILDYVGATKTITVDEPFATTPAAADEIIILSNHVHPIQQIATGVADAVWEEAIADHSGTSGSTAEALNAAGAAGDPWTTQLPGAYGAGSAGKIVGDNINATISSRASQTSVDDVPTNAELATALGTADDAVLAQIALVKAKTDNLPTDPADQSLIISATDALATLIADVPTNAELATALGTADDAVLAQIALVKAKTDNLPTDPADQSLVIAVTDALATLIADVPTNAELATALGTADDAVLAQVALVKAKTDNLPAAPAAVGDIPTATANADALLDRAAGVETGWTLRQAMRIMLSVLAGKASGLETTTAVFRDMGDSKNRITATVDANGNRSAVTPDAT